ncbi:hypothetical protein HK103_002701 [Boothiomyces macroporosus]|uniref:Uncharacterized protein n=1 Tax=Boothiomyces macroporosus TaxID=261099 RepID=A0AAD5YB88_9FUNG|nr:hypothetical protein HK103_002701 [Boothiomyces macroporosus]
MNININMNGKQPFLLNDIKNVLRQGGNVTHILNLKVSNQPDTATGDEIRKAIYRQIANRQLTHQVLGVAVTITWRTSAKQTSAYYHCDVAGLFGDRAVKLHTQVLLQHVLNAIDNQFNNIFSTNRTGLSFIVTKPLARPPVPDFDFEENVELEPELDDTEENY